MLRTVRDVSSTFPCVSLPGMNKTGAKRAGSTHPGRYTPWHESLSRPIIRTYSAEVTSLIASNLPHHRSAPFDRRLTIVQQEPPGSQALFCPHPKVFSRFSGFYHETVCATLPNAKRRTPYRGSPFCRGGACPARGTEGTSERREGQAPYRYKFTYPVRVNTPRPSKPSSWRACRSRRTRRPASPAGRGCTGRTPPPPPSSSPRRPHRRTTWSWRSLPGSPSSP